MTCHEHHATPTRAAAMDAPDQAPAVFGSVRGHLVVLDRTHDEPDPWSMSRGAQPRLSKTVTFARWPLDEPPWLIVLATTARGRRPRPATRHPAATCQTVTQIDNAHFCLLALAETMQSRYTPRNPGEHGGRCRPPIVVSVDDLTALREQLTRLWRHISTEQQPATSPAVHALEQLQLHGQPVGIHVASPAEPNPRRSRARDPRSAHTARPWRRRDTVRRAS